MTDFETEYMEGVRIGALIGTALLLIVTVAGIGIAVFW